jgi:phosphate regulon transcriptional regulator PhoB
MQRILVVDDEIDLLDLVEYNLHRAHFAVLRAENGTDALASAKANAPDLILLDVMLPDINGHQVLAKLREDEATRRIPVIMLTAKSGESDMLEGFESGADDYVSKPFSPRELLARMRAVLKRSGDKEPTHREIEFNELKIDLDAHRVWIDSAELPLAPQEFRLLVYFASNPGRVHSREALLTKAWDEDIYVEPRTVDVHIRRLRSRLESMTASRNWIETVRGAGYRFNPEAPLS